jgi:hypothetical protein
MLQNKIIVAVAAVAIWGTATYPPWKLSYSRQTEGTAVTVSTAVANDWLINEKSLPRFTAPQMTRVGYGYSVDYGRLAVEWAIIAALYYAAIRVAAPRTAELEPKP